MFKHSFAMARILMGGWDGVNSISRRPDYTDIYVDVVSYTANEMEYQIKVSKTN